MTAVRTSDAEWRGDLRQGKGTMRLGSGAFEGAYSFPSRFEEGAGTNPEELIAAAHAGCFSMALAAGSPAPAILDPYPDAGARPPGAPRRGLRDRPIDSDRGRGPGSQRGGLPDACGGGEDQLPGLEGARRAAITLMASLRAESGEL